MYVGLIPAKASITLQIGCSSVEEVQRNIKNVIAAFEVLSNLEQEVLQEAKQTLQPILNQSWPSGLPENN